MIKIKFFPLYPLPPFQCWLKNGQRLAQYILHHIVNIGVEGGGGGEGPIYFVGACQMMLNLEFFPRVLSKIVDVPDFLGSVQLSAVLGTPHLLRKVLWL